MEQTLLTYSLPKEIVTTIMMLYKNTKAMVLSPDGDILFDIDYCKELHSHTQIAWLVLKCQEKTVFYLFIFFVKKSFVKKSFYSIPAKYKNMFVFRHCHFLL